MNLGRTIGYLRACYEADSGKSGIRDFLSSTVEHRWMVDTKEELANGDMPLIPVPHKQAEAAMRKLEMYGREKELVYASVFALRVAPDSPESLQRWCAPLFIWPATLTTRAGEFYAEINLEQRKINPSVLPLFKSTGNSDDLFGRIASAVPDKTVGFAEIGTLARTLEADYPNVVADHLLLYPKLADGKQLRAMLKRKVVANGEQTLLVAASGLGVVDRSGDSVSVLEELKQLTTADDLGPAVKALLTDEGAKKTWARPTYIDSIPAVLSAPQEKIIKSASKYPVSVVIGPPGTGKSYTIAALTVERIAAGDSVLIVSKNAQALEVVANKISNQLNLPTLPVVTSKPYQMYALGQRINRLLRGNDSDLPPWLYDGNDYEMQLRNVSQLLKEAEALFAARVDTELEWSAKLVDKTPHALLQLLRKGYLKLLASQQEPHWEVVQIIENLQNKRIKLATEASRQRFRRQVLAAFDQHFQNFLDYRNGLMADRLVERDHCFSQVNFSKVLLGFPVWLCTTTNLSKVLPLQRGLFDVVIVDEATQCDIASAMPAIYRGKRIVIAGDPHQLKHISFLSRQRQAALAQRFEISAELSTKLNYRDKSILHLASDALRASEQVAFLSEHYRSTPEIVSFSNSEFYNNGLRIMTQHPGKANFNSMEWVRTPGKRTKKGQNTTELAYVIQRIKTIASHQYAVDQAPTIGLLSPFRDQVTAIRKALYEHLEHDLILRHKVLVGTPYQFQGEERDIMLLSFALGEDDHPSAFHYLTRSDMFNVAVTRARHKQVVFTSFDPSRLKQNTLTWRFFHHLLASRKQGEETPNTHHDVFLNEVIAALARDGFEFLPDHTLGGMQIDLVVLHKGRAKGIDLIGYPGDFADAFSLERYYMLQRAGLPVFPLPYSYWTLYREQCLKELEDWLA